MCPAPAGVMPWVNKAVTLLDVSLSSPIFVSVSMQQCVPCVVVVVTLFSKVDLKQRMFYRRIIRP